MNVFIGRKRLEYYNGLLIKADMGLHRQIAQKLQVLVPPPAKILDFGAGEGALSERLVDSGYQVVAVDIDKTKFKCKRAKFIRVNLDNEQEITAFVQENEGSFDAVLGIEVIEHLENQWEYLRRIRKMIRAGGTLIITTPNTSSWLSRIHFLFTARFHQFDDDDLAYGHSAPISPWELQYLMQETGFTEVSIEPAGTLPTIFISNPKTLFYNTIALFFKPFMSGIINGWCVLACGKNSQ